MPRRPFPQIQHTEADAAVVQGVQALARADVRTWQYCPCAFIKGMNDIKLGGGSWGLAPEFQRAAEARQCVYIRAGVPERKPRKDMVWSCEGEAKGAVETPGC